MLKEMGIQDYIISGDISVNKMMQKMDANGKGILFVCEQERLKGVVSDGDIRRYMLCGGDMQRSVADMANYSPRSLRADAKEDMKQYMQKYRITAVPILDSERKIIRIYFDTGEMIQNYQRLKLPVVVMAGGKGTRLYPYTRILPKPLIPIGEKTITEHIIERFSRFGCNDVTMIVNYKKKFIETYFAETETDFHINFLEEEVFGGTGGGLRLLKNMDTTFFMTNCDVLVEADYADILSCHCKQKNILTMVCAKKKTEIPYGTVEVDTEGKVKSMQEKPVFSFLTNTGFYVIEPEFIDMIPKQPVVHITDVIGICVKAGKRVGVYTVDADAWMDMGQLDELEKMKKRLE